MTAVSLTINGRAVAAEVEPRTHLADFIRDTQTLTGTHLGCEHGVCGACTVQIDGKPVRACLTLAQQVRGAEVRTVEALALDPIVLSPLLGFVLALVLALVVSWTFVRATPFTVDSTFRNLQFVSAALYSLGHGGNDAQKTMGIIVLLLSAANLHHWAEPDPHSWTNALNLFGHEHNVAWWIILTCHAAIALGTMFGGWRIVKTMGSGITRLAPFGGFCAETAAAAVSPPAVSMAARIWVSSPRAGFRSR